MKPRATKKSILTDAQHQALESISEGKVRFDDGMPELTPKEIARVLPLQLRSSSSKDRRETITARFTGWVLDYYRASGPGYQARMDDALKRLIRLESVDSSDPILRLRALHLQREAEHFDEVLLPALRKAAGSVSTSGRSKPSKHRRQKTA
jgi:uncharacterized protein (DUF4415 family)